VTKPHIRVVAAEIERNGRFLITQRRPKASMPLLWEFPGGRVEQDETDAEALAREIYARLGIAIKVGEQILLVSHEYTDYAIDLAVYRATGEGEVAALQVHDFRWVLPEEFDQYEFPGADAHTVEQLLKG
jgi:8-oxo-dGTP diphosphatase